MTNRLTNAENLNETIEIATKAIGKVVDGEVSCICFDEEQEEKEEQKDPAFEEWQICGKNI